MLTIKAEAAVSKVTFVNMTARCGSTLLGQMISRTPKAFVMSEPWAWMHLHGHYIGGDIPMAAYREGITYSNNLGLHKLPRQYKPYLEGVDFLQEAAEERGVSAVQAGEEQGRRAHLCQDGDVHVASVSHAERDVPQGQVHLQHEGVQVDGRVHDAARQVPAHPRYANRSILPGGFAC